MTKAKLRGRSPISTMAVMIRRWRLWLRRECFNSVTPGWLITAYFPWCIPNCIVDDCRERVPMAHLEIFPDPVEDHDGVCQGISRERQEGGDEQEGDLLLQHVKHPQHGQHVVKGRDRRCNPEPELKAGRDVENDAQHRNRDGDEGILLEPLPDGRTDLITGIDDEGDRREILRS